ncbi:MAG: 5-oxoprolinase subunit PxpB [Candidatus Fimenecus sp.]
MEQPLILHAGDSALVVEFGREIAEDINARVHALDAAVRQKHIIGVTETVPTFRSLTVFYDPSVLSYERLQRKLLKLCKGISVSADTGKKVVEVPVLYGGSYGEDLQDVAAHAGLTAEEVIKIHTGTDYRIFMLGFLPGFVYLGGMDKRIACPRLETPRTKIHAGAVGIGGEQTGIYPLASPGGWRLIGTTPVRPYDNTRTPPVLFSAGEYIRFVSVTEDEYREIEQQVQNGTYVCKVTGGAEK